jgi:TRAP-type mannitol/chloroaromatic compound transport system permease small subunit
VEGLLNFSRAIDSLNKGFSKIADWLVLLACLVSASNAAIRYAFSISSNAWLEIQWYMFAALVMLGTSYTLKMNEHVRVDVFYGRLQPRARAWVDLIGFILFLMPATALLTWLSWPFFYNSFRASEMSANPVGLILWPAQIMLPLGFSLLALQGVSEIIKRIGYLAGRYDMNTDYEKPPQ